MLLLAASLILGACTCSSSGESSSDTLRPTHGNTKPPGSKYVPGQVIVQFKPETQEQDITKMASTLNMAVGKKIMAPNTWLMEITDGSSVEDAITRLTRQKIVINAEPNYIRTIN